MNDFVYDLAVYGDELIACGFFTEAGGNTCGRHIARFHGDRWRRLGCGADGVVSTLLAVDTDLYVGGSFQVIGAAVASNVARWDGGWWYAVGDGLHNSVDALARYDGELVAGGSFDQSDGSPGNLVARWDGSAWQAMGQGLVGKWVLALAEFEGHLYAGGTFTEADGNPAGNIARWDGTGWDTFGTMITGSGIGWCWDVETVSAEYDAKLVVGGDFTHINGVFMNGLAAWDGASWTALGTGLSEGANILDVAVYNGELVAFGYFYAPDGSHGIARWNGTEWHGLGSGWDWLYPFGGPGAAAVYDGDLYVGGGIDRAGGKPSAFIARWTDEGATDAPVATQAATALLSVRPNPFAGETTIAYSVGTPMNVRLAVYDTSGRLVRTLVRDTVASGAHAVRWSGTDGAGRPVAAGVYFLRLDAPESATTQKVVLTR
jgi:hypothetical protein